MTYVLMFAVRCKTHDIGEVDGEEQEAGEDQPRFSAWIRKRIYQFFNKVSQAILTISEYIPK